MPNRMISLERNTNETQIDLTLDLDGTLSNYDTIAALAKQGGLYLSLIHI